MNMASNLNWHYMPWILFYQQVSKTQEEIVMAYKNKDLRLVYQLQRKLVTSLPGRGLPIRRVVTNSGGKKKPQEWINSYGTPHPNGWMPYSSSRRLLTTRKGRKQPP